MQKGRLFCTFAFLNENEPIFMDKKTAELEIMNHIERKIWALGDSSCLLSLNASSLGCAVDVCRCVRYFETLLEQWQECLPLGDAHDLNFTSWGSKMWELIKEVARVYSLCNVQVNFYEYEDDSYLNFKEAQQQFDAFDDSMLALQQVRGVDVPKILVCGLRELNEVLMEISEFLAAPTEELISSSYEQWEKNYHRHYSGKLQRQYKKWKIQYSTRTLKKHLQERMEAELEDFKKLFVNDDEFEQVFDVDVRNIDRDGLMRFLFTHSERFGVSFIDERPRYSDELLRLFSFVELWELMQLDLTPSKKQTATAAAVRAAEKDAVEEKVMELVGRLDHLVVAEWSGRIVSLWKCIYQKFKMEIGKAGAHEKFKGYSKKTLYCIVGHLKMKGVYSPSATNVEVVKLLEGCNNGMRKYVNNGLDELDPKLHDRLKAFLKEELARVA